MILQNCRLNVPNTTYLAVFPENSYLKEICQKQKSLFKHRSKTVEFISIIVIDTDATLVA